MIHLELDKAIQKAIKVAAKIQSTGDRITTALNIKFEIHKYSTITPFITYFEFKRVSPGFVFFLP